MTDAELITRLRADVDAHVMTGNGGMKRVEAIRLAADRLTQLSEALSDMIAVADQDGWDKSLTGRQIIIRNARAALAQGQKEGTDDRS